MLTQPKNNFNIVYLHFRYIRLKIRVRFIKGLSQGVFVTGTVCRPGPFVVGTVCRRDCLLPGAFVSGMFVSGGFVAGSVCLGYVGRCTGNSIGGLNKIQIPGFR